VLEVSRFGITTRFDNSPWPNAVPSLYRPFLKNEYYEQGFLDHIRSLRRRGVYIDAGSCLGTHTVWFAVYCRSTQVHAFDPRPKCARWTQMNVDANQVAQKVIVHEVGLSDSTGEATSHLDGVDVTFPVRRLDDIVTRGQIAVIKVDVEGMEVPALKGADRILRKHRPLVFAEAFTEADRAAVEAVLAPYGYRATGRVFNSTPTYEFEAPPTVAQRLRARAQRLPRPLRKAIVVARNAVTRH
jgi:FkbM family methyltransferase